MIKNRRLKIGIVGCGAIGGSLAKEIVIGLRDSACLVALYDIRLEKARALSKQLAKNTKFCVNSLEALIRNSDLVIESSCAESAWEIVRKSLTSARKVLVMSVGGIVGHLDQLSVLATKYNAQAYFPSGAICGIDGLKAANIAGVQRIVLTTRKHPDAFNGVEYVTKKFKLAGLSLRG